MRAHVSPLKGKKKEKISSYTSPFVAKAQARALERAREARKHLPRHGFVRNEWDSTTPTQPGHGDHKEETPHAPLLSSRDPYPLRPSSGSAQLDEREQQVRDASEKRYGDLIRERLRTLLYDRMGLREGVDDRKRAQQRVRPPYYTYQDPQQAFTRDMMANMANIMQAVGTIVSGVNESRKPRRRRLFSRSRPISPSPYLSPDVLLDERDHHLYSQTKPPKPPRQEAPLPLSPSSPPAAALSAGQQAMKTTTGGNNENWTWQVSQAILEKKRLPKSKSGVLDMVLAKLQAIEENEREIALYLKQQQQHVTTNTMFLDENINKEVTLVMKKSKGKFKLTKELLETVTTDPDHPSRTSPPSPSPLTKTKLNKIEFPKLTAPNDLNNDTYRYMEELRSARRLREVAYEARSSSLSQTVTSITDMLADRMIGSVVKDLETIMEDCSEGVLKTV
eukprot:gene9573-10580_t